MYIPVYFYHFCRFGIGRDFTDKVRLYENRKTFGTNISHHYYENGINYIKHKESKDIEFKKNISKLQSNSKLEMNRINKHKEQNEQLKSQSKELKEYFDEKLRSQSMELNEKFDEKFDGLLKMLRGFKEELFPSENVKKACKSTAKHHGVRDQNPHPRNRTRGKSVRIKRGEVQTLVQLFSQSLENAS